MLLSPIEFYDVPLVNKDTESCICDSRYQLLAVVYRRNWKRNNRLMMLNNRRWWRRWWLMMLNYRLMMLNNRRRRWWLMMFNYRLMLLLVRRWRWRYFERITTRPELHLRFILRNRNNNRIVHQITHLSVIQYHFFWSSNNPIRANPPIITGIIHAGVVAAFTPALAACS